MVSEGVDVMPNNLVVDASLQKDGKVALKLENGDLVS